METMKKSTFSLSLIQTISAVFFTITLLVILLFVTSIKGLENIRQRFSELSQQALPLAMTNAELTQNILEQVKQLSYATGTQSIESLCCTSIRFRLLLVCRILAISERLREHHVNSLLLR